MNNGFLKFDWIFRLTPLYQKQKQALKVVKELVTEIIEKRRVELMNELKENGNVETNEDEFQKKRPALLEILLKSEMDGKPLTNEDIRSEVKTFMLAVS